ncbi:DUF3288 family protein [Synechococcus sp. M16CYN]|uniref:DUF3288 family protein n=1 Tax=Synechococcus sp. M16CYN TaxID=3103139 RepID=UPI0032434606
MSEDTSQVHPLYTTDRNEVDALLRHQDDPGPEQLTTAGRLSIRYSDFPGAVDIKQDLRKVMAAWGLKRADLNAKCREIWSSGWRPGQQIDSDVGSGADVDDREI